MMRFHLYVLEEYMLFITVVSNPLAQLKPHAVCSHAEIGSVDSLL